MTSATLPVRPNPRNSAQNHILPLSPVRQDDASVSIEASAVRAQSSSCSPVPPLTPTPPRIAPSLLDRQAAGRQDEARIDAVYAEAAGAGLGDRPELAARSRPGDGGVGLAGGDGERGELGAVHPFEEHRVAAGVDHRHRDADAESVRAVPGARGEPAGLLQFHRHAAAPGTRYRCSGRPGASQFSEKRAPARRSPLCRRIIALVM